MDPESRLEELVGLARQGDREAFTALIEAFRGALEVHIRRRVGSHLRSRVDVDDVVQEAFAEAWASIQRFDWRGESSFLRWLQRIGELRVLRVASRTRPEHELLVPNEAVSIAEVTPSQRLQREERFDRLQRALDSLPPEYRQVIVLARLQGLTLKEIADRMDRSIHSVTHLLSRALDKLKDHFGDTDSFHLPPRQIEASGGGADGEAKDAGR